MPNEPDSRSPMLNSVLASGNRAPSRPWPQRGEVSDGCRHDLPAGPDDVQPLLAVETAEECDPGLELVIVGQQGRVGIADHRLQQVVAGVGEPVHVARWASWVRLGGSADDVRQFLAGVPEQVVTLSAVDGEAGIVIALVGEGQRGDRIADVADREQIVHVPGDDQTQRDGS
jgi:hypothetical protein